MSCSSSTSELDCLGMWIGKWRGGRERWPRPELSFMRQAWNPFHTSVVESDLSTAWHMYKLLFQVFFCFPDCPPSLCLLPDKKEEGRQRILLYCAHSTLRTQNEYTESYSQVANITVCTYLCTYTPHTALLTFCRVREEGKFFNL